MFTSRDMGYLEKIIIGIFATLLDIGYFPIYLKGYRILVPPPPIQASIMENSSIVTSNLSKSADRLRNQAQPYLQVSAKKRFLNSDTFCIA